MDSLLANIQAKFALPPEVEEVYSRALVQWLRRLLRREPGDRPDAAQLSAEVERFRAKGTESPGAEARALSRSDAETTTGTASVAAASALWPCRGSCILRGGQ